MPSAAPKRYAVAYVPVIHRGYMEFFKKAKADRIFVLGSELIETVDYLRKDLRALKPETAAALVTSLGYESEVLGSVKKLDAPDVELIFADEDISREVAKSFKKAKLTFLPVFLRWDRETVEKLGEDVQTTDSREHQELMTKALNISKQSSDIWRHVGAVMVSAEGNELASDCNQAEPNPHSPWMEGDPRNVFKRGVGIEMSVFSHAEAVLIAEAAKKGVATGGASLYVTTFPCPVCAKLIARSGIKNLYYHEGYAVLDGKRLLDEYGVRIQKVEVDYSEPGEGKVPYKSKSS